MVMKKWDQSHLIQQMSDKELRLNIYFSQFIFFAAGLLTIWFSGVNMEAVMKSFQWEAFSILVVGAGTAIGVVILNVILHKYLPESYLDDGGINERIFHKLPIGHIAVLTAVISFSEEWLFRGAIQPLLGLGLTSVLFAVLHVRYIKKPVLFSVAVLLSFILGYLYDTTGNLLVPMTAHFLIDFLLGWMLSKGWFAKSAPINEDGGGFFEKHE